MPTPRLTPAQLQETIDLIKRWGSCSEASRQTGIPTETLRSRLSRARVEVPKQDGKDERIAVLESEVRRLTALQDFRPRFTLRQDLHQSSSKIRAVWVGDLHDSPKIPDKSRFAWIGRYVNDTRPDVLGLIGDALTMDSLNSHIPNENYDGKAKPSFIADIASGHLAFDAMCEEIKFELEKHETDGNHERRLYMFENTAPETVGMMQRDYDHLLESHGFTHSPYGQIQYYGGVGFVHAALNTLGKTYGGKNCLPTIANDSVSDLVVGHSHRARVHQAPKIGQRYPTTIIDLGCALPDGHVEEYATHALNGWTYGIYDLLIQFGHVQSAKFISMTELGERYGTT